MDQALERSRQTTRYKGKTRTSWRSDASTKSLPQVCQHRAEDMKNKDLSDFVHRFPKPRTATLFRFFAAVTSRIHWGQWDGPNNWPEDQLKDIRQRNTKNRVIAYCNRGRESFFFSKISNKLYQKHLDLDCTLYFCGTGSTKDEYTLAYMDVDVQKTKRKGSIQGATRFLEHLRKTFPDLYSEPASQTGMGAYLLIHKSNSEGPEEINTALDHLQEWLRHEALRTNADIEKVEVMGHCPVYRREEIVTEDGRRVDYVVDVQGYKLGKLPRGEGVLNTTIVRAEDLLKLEIAPVILPIKKESESSGSLRLVRDEELAQLSKYERLAGELLGDQELGTSGRQKVTCRDLAIFLMILKVLTGHMNKDGTMPSARIAGLWQALYMEAQVDRAFDKHRLTAMRDFLSSLGLLAWEDDRYCPGRTACKWHASEELLTMMDTGKIETQNTHTSLGGTTFSLTGMFTRPRLVFGLLKGDEDDGNWEQAYQEVERMLLAG